MSLDYEKKYKEALSRAKQFSKHPLLEDNNSIAEYIFPELQKYNDEKIKEAIIHFISHTPTVPKGIIGKKIMLAWLENQGKSNLCGQITIE